MTDFSRRQEVIWKLKAQMRLVCDQGAHDIKIIRAAAVPPHVIHAVEPHRGWAVAPDLGWPNVHYSDPKELLRHERLP